MSVRIVAPITWSDIGDWYNGLAKDRYVLDPATTAKVDAVVHLARSRADTLRALHHWIAHDLHAIAAIPQSGTPSGYLFTDLTTDAIPPTAMPASYRDKLLIVVKGDASTEVILPKQMTPNDGDARIDAELAPDGKISGHFATTTHGAAAYSLTMLAERADDSTHRATITRAIAGSIFPHARGDSLVLPDTSADTNDPAHVATMSVHFRDGEGAKAADPLMLLSLPFTFHAQPGRFATLMDRMDDPDNEYAKDPRRLPIDGSKIFASGKNSDEMTIRLPKGWKAQLPKNVSATDPFGSYVSEYALTVRNLTVRNLTVRNLTVRRLVTGPCDVVSKDQYPALVVWMKAIAADKVEYIVLQPLSQQRPRSQSGLPTRASLELMARSIHI